MIMACQCGARPLKKRKRTVSWKGITLHGVPTYECPRCKGIYYEPRTRSRLDELAKNATADKIYFTAKAASGKSGNDSKEKKSAKADSPNPNR